MKFSVEHFQEQFLAYMNDNFAQKIVHKAWRDAELMAVKNGNVPVYISVEFADVQPGRSHSAIGVWGDNHTLPIAFYAMGPDMDIVKKLQNKIFYTALGFTTEFSGEVKKRAGGQLMPLTASNGALEGYSVLIMFDVSIQLAFME